jgi:F-type H+-transporting ATPase subunit alpha
MESLKQKQRQPLPVEKQIMLLYAAINGFVDTYPESVLPRYETELFAFMDGKHPDILAEIGEKKEIKRELEEKIVAALNEFKELFSV